jgi:hypothetical protein
MLGAPYEGGFAVGHQTLDPGTSLMFYTDGLIEDRRRDITDGLSALAGVMARVMASPAPLSAERTCAAVQAALLGETPRADDVCLLAIRLTGLSHLSRSWPGPVGRVWLAGSGWPGLVGRVRGGGKATSRLSKRYKVLGTRTRRSRTR